MELTKRNFKQLNLNYKNFNLLSAEVYPLNKLKTDPIDRNDPLYVTLEYDHYGDESLTFTLKLKGEDGIIFLTTNSGFDGSDLQKGSKKLSFEIPDMFLNEGSYSIDVLVVKDRKKSVILENDVLQFNINPEEKTLGSWMAKVPCYIRPRLNTFYS